MQRPEELVHGLNLINSTNLDYFQPQHQARPALHFRSWWPGFG